MGRLVWSSALIACLAASARADIPPPPPAKGLKRVPYVIAMKLEKEIPGYTFYTFSRLGLGGQETIRDELKLDTATAVAGPSSSSPSVRTGVVAVPRAVMDELETKENLAKLLSRDGKDKLPPNVVVYETRGTSSDLKESDPRTKVEVVVTISPDEKAGVKFTAKEAPAPPGRDEEGEASAPAARSPFALAVAGVAGALAVATLGVWYFRRK